MVEGARLEIVCTFLSVPRVRIPLSPPIMVVSVGPLATRNCEPRQVRKEAAAAMDTCAGVWLARAATLFLLQITII